MSEVLVWLGFFGLHTVELSDSLTRLCIVERSLDDHIPAVPRAGLGPAAAGAESAPAGPAYRLGQVSEAVMMMLVIMMMNILNMITNDRTLFAMFARSNLNF